MNHFLAYCCLFFSRCLSSSSSRSKSVQQNTSPASGSRRLASEASVIATFDVTQSATTLRQILEDAELLDSFIIYATSKRASENIRFLKDYLNIKNVKEELEKYYRKLVADFISEDSEYQVNLPSELVCKFKSKYLNDEELIEIITEAAEVVFLDLKLSQIFRSFIQKDEKILAKSLDVNLVNDYLKCADNDEIDSLFKNTDYGRLIRFVLSAQRFELEKPGITKKQIGSKIFINFISLGGPFEIPREFVTEFYSKLLERDDYSTISDIRIEVIHYLLRFEDIVSKARAWKAGPTNRIESVNYWVSMKY